MKCRILRQRDELVGVSEEWNRLAIESANSTPYSLPDFCISWLECTEHEPFVIGVWSKGRLVGLAPLFINRGIIQFIGSPVFDYNLVLYSKEEALAEIYNCLVSEQKSWEKVILEEIPSGRVFDSIYGVFCGKGFHCSHSLTNPCLGLDFAKEGAEKLLDKRDTAKRMRRLSREGSLALERAETVESAISGLERLFAMHQNLWASRGETSMFNDRRMCEFFVKATSKLLPKKIVEVYSLKFNKEAIAIQLGFVWKERYYLFVTAFEQEHPGAGGLLNTMLLSELKARGFTLVDFGRGAESYKQRFANTGSENRGIYICKSRVQHWLSRSVRFGREFVIRHERLHSAITLSRRKILSRSPVGRSTGSRGRGS